MDRNGRPLGIPIIAEMANKSYLDHTYRETAMSGGDLRLSAMFGDSLWAGRTPALRESPNIAEKRNKQTPAKVEGKLLCLEENSGVLAIWGEFLSPPPLPAAVRETPHIAEKERNKQKPTKCEGRLLCLEGNSGFSALCGDGLH